MERGHPSPNTSEMSRVMEDFLTQMRRLKKTDPEAPTFHTSEERSSELALEDVSLESDIEDDFEFITPNQAAEEELVHISHDDAKESWIPVARPQGPLSRPGGEAAPGIKLDGGMQDHVPVLKSPRPMVLDRSQIAASVAQPPIISSESGQPGQNFFPDRPLVTLPHRPRPSRSWHITKSMPQAPNSDAPEKAINFSEWNILPTGSAVITPAANQASGLVIPRPPASNYTRWEEKRDAQGRLYHRWIDVRTLDKTIWHLGGIRECIFCVRKQ